MGIEFGHDVTPCSRRPKRTRCQHLNVSGSPNCDVLAL